MATFTHKSACPKCQDRGEDSSGDNLANYSDGSAYCFACHYVKKGNENYEEEEITWEMSEFTAEDHKKLKKETKTDPRGFRGLKEDVCKFFGVRHQYDVMDGTVSKQFYPYTRNGEFTGYKVRNVPKAFSCLGSVGSDSDLFGQFRFQAGGKYILVVGGEVDQLSAYQMFDDYNKSKGHEDRQPIPVVSPATGEGSSAKQLAAQYSFLDKFERIVLAYDNDAAGKAAMEKIIKVLPRGKVWIMSMSRKDPNEYLEANDVKSFIKHFYDAKKYSPIGVMGSDALFDAVLEKSTLDKISFPPFLPKLNDMTSGGITLKQIINILAGSGAGKSSIANACVYHWVFNSPYKVGIISLEADCAEYGVQLLSGHIKKKLNLMNPRAMREYLNTPEVREQANVLFKDESGDSRFYLIDDRGDFANLPAKIEELIATTGVQVIVIDPLNDIFAGEDNAYQEEFMQWQKQMVKGDDVTFINICHTRKGQGGKNGNLASRGAELSEEDIQGSSTIYKSASMNITLVRDKHAEDEIERNTTKVTVAKNRMTGITGPAGELYYDNQTHTLHDKEEWFRKHPVSF